MFRYCIFCFSVYMLRPLWLRDCGCEHQRNRCLLFLLLFTRPLWAAQLGLQLGPYPHLAVEESVKHFNIWKDELLMSGA